MKTFKSILMMVVAIIFTATAVVAQELPQSLTLPSVVGDNMVLQHSTTVKIWGWAKPKSKLKITPSWTNAKKPLKAKANAEGFWSVDVKTLAASFNPHSVTIQAGKEVKTISNILFGEVWLCSGQSNMQWKVRQTTDMKDELANGKNNAIRLYNTGHTYSKTPQNDVPVQKKHKPGWKVCDRKSLAHFSAVGYGFGKLLQENLNVPIGLIAASYGGTAIEGWLSADYVANNESVAAIVKKAPKKVKARASFYHNANIYPIRYTTLAGVIWYQGCSNVKSNNRSYGTLLGHLITSWRAEFRNEELPFYIVEIAPHVYNGVSGASIREHQARVADRTENCELVCTNDQNWVPGDIHPPKKWDVARRLAQCALGAHYLKTNEEFRSPAYQSMTVEGDAIRVSFKNVPTTLAQRGEGRINGFQIGIKNPENPKYLKFVLAEAKIEGNTILVAAEGVTNPVAVRYCYNEDMGNIISAEGLPLRAFRSDKNRAWSARPYMEQPSEIAVKFEGTGYTRSIFTKDAQLWAETPYVLSDKIPAGFEGYELLCPQVVAKGKYSVGGTVTAEADGKIYILCANHDATRKAPWRILTQSYTFCAKGGKTTSSPFFIAEREVKAGEVVELPKFKHIYGTALLAKSIEYTNVVVDTPAAAPAPAAPAAKPASAPAAKQTTADTADNDNTDDIE